VYRSQLLIRARANPPRAPDAFRFWE